MQLYKMIWIFLFMNFMNLTKIINEMNMKYKLYPRWLTKKNGSFIECKNDSECPFPSACCNDPFFPFQYCCNGWNKRKLEYAYNYNYIK